MAISRREFFLNSAKLATTSALIATGIVSYSKYAYSIPATAIRPPGALKEKDFISACIRCGLCVNDCPFPTLSLATEKDGVAIGTPFFTARKAGCEMCDDIPCVKACPTGALDKSLTDINNSKMGLARIVDTEGCIAYQGLRCEVCFNVCPIRGKAITIEMKHNKRSGSHTLFIPIVNYDHCTGCGKCEEACIMEEAVIKVLPMQLAMGKRQDHYKLGWEEKQKAGGSLVSPDIEHKYNLPEGKQYDLYGKGLTDIKVESSLDNALDSLNSLNPLFNIKRK
jgi:ferredoxin-type protein NapG